MPKIVSKGVYNDKRYCYHPVNYIGIQSHRSSTLNRGLSAMMTGCRCSWKAIVLEGVL